MPAMLVLRRDPRYHERKVESLSLSPLRHIRQDAGERREAFSPANEPSRTASGCGMRMRIVFHEDYVTVGSTGLCSQHAHTSKDSDRWERPSHFQDLPPPR